MPTFAATIAPAPTALYAPSRDERRASAQAARGSAARAASGRRRLVDPSTCERIYAPAEAEFLRAMEEYKRSSGRQFPTWSEALGVLRGLGYAKPAGA